MRVKWRGNYILEGYDSNIGLRQSCSLSLVLFNILTENVFRKWMSSTIMFFLVMLKKQVLTLLLFADDLAL
jgi:hypothetical protein